MKLLPWQTLANVIRKNGANVIYSIFSTKAELNSAGVGIGVESESFIKNSARIGIGIGIVANKTGVGIGIGIEKF